MSTSATIFAPPAADEYNEYYETYIGKFRADDFLTAFEAQNKELRGLLGALPAGEDSKLHAPYTWTLKQLMGHLIDCERIFSTRMLRIAVGDEAPMPGMNQDIYVANLDYENVSMADLLDEFCNQRASNVLFAKRMTAESISRRGTADGNELSAKAALYILAGHVVYHIEKIKERLTVV
jgi:uncharacterized damage-inducible protein DinB